MEDIVSEKYIDYPVFLGGHRKSGTTLLLSLLDNNPELVTYPSDSGFFYLYYPLYDTPDKSQAEKTDRMVDRVLGIVKQDSIEFLSENIRKKLNFNFEKFQTQFLTDIKSTKYFPKDMLCCLIQAFKKVWKSEMEPKGWVEKTTSTEIYATDVFKWFPNAKFIHVVRDPRDNWASLRSGWSERYKDFNASILQLTQSMIDRCRLGMEISKLNSMIYGEDRYLIIKYEDLVSKPDEIMKQIADFIGIDFSDDLLKPTFLGTAWKGNNFEGIKFTGVSSVNKGRWKERIEIEEAALIEFYFKDIMDFYGYPLVTDAKLQAEVAKEHYKWFNFAKIY